mmetsp:Transcript_11252/g.45767  ORF Transcript_11252/g.45767 Transcript_11252/m.45767 type:complete len:229 (+) Transcript_11252:680-1366(+)
MLRWRDRRQAGPLHRRRGPEQRLPRGLLRAVLSAPPARRQVGQHHRRLPLRGRLLFDHRGWLWHPAEARRLPLRDRRLRLVHRARHRGGPHLGPRQHWLGAWPLAGDPKDHSQAREGLQHRHDHPASWRPEGRPRLARLVPAPWRCRHRQRHRGDLRPRQHCALQGNLGRARPRRQHVERHRLLRARPAPHDWCHLRPHCDACVRPWPEHGGRLPPKRCPHPQAPVSD